MGATSSTCVVQSDSSALQSDTPALQSSTSAVKSCIVCDKANATYCSRCRSISYCSKTCQQSDWSTHKLLCASLPTFSAEKRPTANHYRGVPFNPNKAKPEFIWLLCKWVRDDDYGDFQHPETGSYIGSDVFAAEITVTYNERLERPLPNTIFISTRDTFLIDGSPPSKSIASVTATQLGQYHNWCGPIVVYTKSGPSACKDFDMVDWRHATDYLLWYGYRPLEPSLHVLGPQTQARDGIERVKGVRINCVGDTKLLKRPQFEEIELQITHEIFTKHYTSDIADRIGIPILTARLEPDPKWAHDTSNAPFKGESPYNNQYATYLHQCCDPRAKCNLEALGWGWCPAPWQHEVGSAIVVRKDRKPLLVPHMEALAGYCRNEVSQLMAHSHGMYGPEEPIKKGHVLSIICRPMFVLHWAKFVRERSDYDIPSPYDDVM